MKLFILSTDSKNKWSSVKTIENQLLYGGKHIQIAIFDFNDINLKYGAAFINEVDHENIWKNGYYVCS